MLFEIRLHQKMHSGKGHGNAKNYPINYCFLSSIILIL